MLTVAAMLFYPLLVGAQHHTHEGDVRGFHNEHHHSRLHHWYEKLMRPDLPSSSCCNKQDCTPTQAKMVDGKWHAMRAGKWIEIPQSKINREESIDSQAHICFSPWVEDESILCFVKPGSAI